MRTVSSLVASLVMWLVAWWRAIREQIGQYR